LAASPTARALIGKTKGSILEVAAPAAPKFIESGK
jgi:transcription elongation GreA/GreB family factor